MPTGRSDTSLTDTLVNAMALTWVFGRGPWLSIACGDDVCTVMPRWYYDALGGPAYLVSAFLEFGLDITVDLSDCVQDVTFCSARFMQIGNQLTAVPKLGRLLARIPVDFKSDTVKLSKKLLYEKGVSIAPFGKIDPNIGHFSRWLMRHGSQSQSSVQRNDWDRWSDGSLESTPLDVYRYYADNYGLDVAMTDGIASAIANMAPGIVDDPILCHIVDTDT